MSAPDPTAPESPRPLTPEGPGFWGWISILSGILSFMVLWSQFYVLWILSLAFMIWGRRRSDLPYGLLLVLTALAGVPALWHYANTRDSIGGFGLFLVLSSCITLAGARRRQEHRVPFLLSFIMLMAAGHRTLEIFYLVPVGLFFLGYTLARTGDTAEDPTALPRWRTTALMLLATVLLSVPIFLFMPRTRMSVMALATRANLSGFGGAIRFGEMGEMQLSDRVIMRVRTKSVAYLRGITLDAYSRSGWRNTYKGARELAGPDRALLAVDKDQVGPGKLVDDSPEAADEEGRPPVDSQAGVYVQDVILESFDQPVLFTSGVCLAVFAPGQTLTATTPGDVTRSTEARNEKLIYRVYSLPVRMDRPGLSEVVSPEKTGFRHRYLQLPDNFPGRVRARAEEVLRGKRTLLERCQAMVEYLQGNFTYSLTRTVQRGLDPVEDLLFGDPRGHCEYFASAMAVMLRSQGVFSRVVIGFTAGDFNPYSGTFTVRERDAHAWVEVFFGDEFGWIPFDPTPADPSEEALGVQNSDLFLLMNAGLDQLDAWWQNEVVNYYFNQGGPAIESWLYRLDDFLVDGIGLSWLRYPPKDLWTQVGKGVAGVIALVLLIWGMIREGGPAKLLRALWAWLLGLLARLARPLARASARRSPRTFGEAGKIYRRWLAELEARELPRPTSATPREFLALVEARFPEEGERGRRITQAYELEEFAEEVPTELLSEIRVLFPAETR